jgi:hypothetical protein
MGFIGRMDQRARKLSAFDLKLVQGVAVFFALIIATLIPQIMDIDIWWFVGLGILCAIKPCYVFWFKRI